MEPPKPPIPLGEPGTALWEQVVSAYDGDPLDLALLAEACATRDELQRLRFAFWQEEQAATTKGSRRQVRVNPLVPAIVTHRQLFASLVGHVRPSQADMGSARSDAARRAAEARWANRGPRVVSS